MNNHLLRCSFVSFCLFLTFLAPARGEDLTANLEKIVLRENPTRNDVVAYVKALTKSFDAFSDEQQQALRENSRPMPSGSGMMISVIQDVLSVAPGYIQIYTIKIKQVPAAYIDLLLNKSTPSNFRLIVSSINERKNLTAASREAVIEYLPQYPALITSVMENNWKDGAEKAVLKAAKSLRDTSVAEQSTIPSYIPVLAQIDRPEARKVLVELLACGTAEIMAASYNKIPDVDAAWLQISKAVDKSWKKAKENARSSSYPYAPIAAGYGHVDALVSMAKKLNSAPLLYDTYDAELRGRFGVALLKLMPPEITEENDAVKFVLSNRDRLVFDPGLKEYKVGR